MDEFNAKVDVKARDLDARVAIEVMGWTELWSGGKYRMAYPPCEQVMPTINESERHHVPHYSTDMTAAWCVVERMRELGWTEHIRGYIGDDRGEHVCTFYNDDQMIDSEWHWADTAPEAICAAALAAVGGGEHA
jgi:hypothetical protein